MSKMMRYLEWKKFDEIVYIACINIVMKYQHSPQKLTFQKYYDAIRVSLSQFYAWWAEEQERKVPMKV